MAQLILVRHGETDWSRQNRVQGTLDIPLNGDGEDEARRISDGLSEFEIHAVYSSPASCSFCTAQEIATSRSLKVKKMNELKELNHGVWQGLLVKDIKKRYKKQYSIWKSSPTSSRPPSGESMRDACDRAVSAMHKIVDRHKDESVCLVSGCMVLSIIKCYLKNVELDKIWKFVPGKSWEVFQL